MSAHRCMLAGIAPREANPGDRWTCPRCGAAWRRTKPRTKRWWRNWWAPTGYWRRESIFSRLFLRPADGEERTNG